MYYIWEKTIKKMENIGYWTREELGFEKIGNNKI